MRTDPSHPIASLIDKAPGLSHNLKLVLESLESRIGFVIRRIHLNVFLKILNFQLNQIYTHSGDAIWKTKIQYIPIPVDKGIPDYHSSQA